MWDVCGGIRVVWTAHISPMSSSNLLQIAVAQVSQLQYKSRPTGSFILWWLFRSRVVSSRRHMSFFYSFNNAINTWYKCAFRC